MIVELQPAIPFSHKNQPQYTTTSTVLPQTTDSQVMQVAVARAVNANGSLQVDKLAKVGGWCERVQISREAKSIQDVSVGPTEASAQATNKPPKPRDD